MPLPHRRFRFLPARPLDRRQCVCLAFLCGMLAAILLTGGGWAVGVAYESAVMASIHPHIVVVPVIYSKPPRSI